MKSNVLLFVCDDLRWNALSGMGHPEVKTPHIDQLMTDGASFTRCYMPGGSDGAVCMPSRAMLHTGRSLFEIDREGQEIPEGHTSIGQHLQLHGYNCFHTGKWHNGVAGFARSFNDGDEIFFGGMGDQYNMPLHRFDPSGRYESRIARAPDAFHSKELEFQSGDHTSDGKHATDVFIDAADSYIRRRQDSDTPFLLSIALTAPHDPRTAPPNFHEQYNPEDTTLPENFLAYHPHQTGALNSRDENLASHPRKPEEIKEHIADYHAMIAHLDEGLGKLRQALDDTGQRENTLIVFTADHGIAIGQHGLMGKQCLYEHSLRIPLILAGPRIPKNKRIHSLVRHFDLFPTLCDLLEIETPSTVTSKSLLPHFKGQAPTDRDLLYLAYQDSIRGIVSENWKLIEYAQQDYRATQLFHLGKDPLEISNLAHLEAYTEKVHELRMLMIELRSSGKDLDHRLGKTFWSHCEFSES